jgi:hypothetical protein
VEEEAPDFFGVLVDVIPIGVPFDVDLEVDEDSGAET